MKNLKNPIFIVGAIAFLIVAGLVWNYTEAIKAKNTVEEKRLRADLIEQCSTQWRELIQREEAKIEVGTYESYFDNSYCQVYKNMKDLNESLYCADGILVSHTEQTYTDYCLENKTARL